MPPKAKLSLRLDRPKQLHAAGEPVRGQIHVQAASDCRCKGLGLAWNWRTRGSGNPTDGKGGQLQLFQSGSEAEWQAGGEYVYPFEFPAPDWPLTHMGGALNVEWVLQARADVPWSVDPGAETSFRVGAGPTPWVPSRWFPREGAWLRFPTIKELPGAQVLLLLLGGLVPIAFGVLHFRHARRAEGVELGVGLAFIAFGLVFLALAAWLAPAPARRALARLKLGRIRLHVGSRTAAAGQSLRVAVSFKPRVGLSLHKATVALVAHERVVSGHGKRRRVLGYKAPLVQVPLLPAAGGDQPAPALPRGVRVRYETDLLVPRHTPPSFVARHNELTWSVLTELELEPGVGWTREVSVRVLPGGQVPVERSASGRSSTGADAASVQ